MRLLTRNLTRLLVWLVVIFVCVLTELSYTVKVLAAGDYWKGRVIKVTDGDTIWIRLENGNKVKVRIWGIDTPEKYKSKKLFKDAKRCGVQPWKMAELGKLASEKAEEILDSSVVYLEPKGRGYYGRILAVVYLPDGTDFSKEMLQSGYACTYDRNTSKEYLEFERKAQEARAGLWSQYYDVMKCLCD